MSSKVLMAVMALVLALAPAPVQAAAHSAPKPRVPAREPELPGEEPGDEPPVSYADDWPVSFVPDLIDIPAAELVERHHPTLVLGYASRHLGPDSFANVVEARQSGGRFSLHVRVGRDFQVSAEVPFYQTVTSLKGGPPNDDRSISGLAGEVKYLVPYEVAGVRAALGFRRLFADDNQRFLFTPDDWRRMNEVYVTAGKTPTPYMRLHLMLAKAFVESLDGLPQGEHTLVALGLEQQVFRLEHNWVRLIGEVGKPKFDTLAHGAYGHLGHADSPYVNAALRVRSGTIQCEVGVRRLNQSGYGESYANIVRRF